LEIVGGLDESRSVGEDSYLFCQLGIGGMACAVSGIGCVQTADDISNVRLTVDNPLESEIYLSEGCKRWRDVLSWKRRLPSQYSRLVAFNLADAHLGLGKSMWRSGRRVGAMAVCVNAYNGALSLSGERGCWVGSLAHPEPNFVWL
jgi:hypothetical protein